MRKSILAAILVLSLGICHHILAQDKEPETIQQAVKVNSFGFAFRVHPMVTQFISYYQKRGRQIMKKGLARSRKYERIAREIFKEEGVPENLIWMAQATSGWNSHQTGGLWSANFLYKLKTSPEIDEARDFENSTRLVAKYLKSTSVRYENNWELAIAAHFAGEGNIDLAIKKAGVTDFWASYPYLPRETRNYVPNVVAVILVANNPKRYGFEDVKYDLPLTFEKVTVAPKTNLVLLAEKLKIKPEELKELNPALLKNYTPNKSYLLRVPEGRAIEVPEIMRSLPETTKPEPELEKPKQTTRTFLVKANEGDTIRKLSLRYRASLEKTAEINGLLPDSILKAGQEIKIITRP